MPATATCSAKRLAANRANARRSTGPRTPAGRRRAAMNAVSHGYFCQDPVLPGESEPLFRSIRRQFVAYYRPQALPELAVVERLVMANWKLRRLAAAERHAVDQRLVALADLAAQQAAKLAGWAAEDLADERRYRKDPALPEAALAVADAEFAETVARRDAMASTAAALAAGGGAAAVAAVLSGDPGGGAVERIARLAARLQAEATRCERQLRQMRDDLEAWTARPTSPFLDADEDAKGDEHEPDACGGRNGGSPNDKAVGPVAETQSAVVEAVPDTAADAEREASLPAIDPEPVRPRSFAQNEPTTAPETPAPSAPAPPNNDVEEPFPAG
ncbi:MAG TPA: hypothetical protein VK324_12520 [Tepidisphaeraceae bacterium]|nr:hypothetical protein [Tepidisphaeraceae bacterium]